MDQAALVNDPPLFKEQIEAGAEFVRRFRAKRPVMIAYWFKEPDDYRYLWIVSEDAGKPGLREAYADLISVAAGFETSPDLDTSRIKLISDGWKSAQAALKLVTDYPPAAGRRMGTTTLGDLSGDDCYIYPLSLTEPAPA